MPDGGLLRLRLGPAAGRGRLFAAITVKLDGLSTLLSVVEAGESCPRLSIALRSASLGIRQSLSVLANLSWLGINAMLASAVIYCNDK